eukprot:3031480-Amphidinium_carterae.1
MNSVTCVKVSNEISTPMSTSPPKSLAKGPLKESRIRNPKTGQTIQSEVLTFWPSYLLNPDGSNFVQTTLYNGTQKYGPNRV